eukprot:7127645-Pyramimonas_sp.AAC.1
MALALSSLSEVTALSRRPRTESNRTLSWPPQARAKHQATTECSQSAPASHCLLVPLGSGHSREQSGK